MITTKKNEFWNHFKQMTKKPKATLLMIAAIGVTSIGHAQNTADYSKNHLLAQFNKESPILLNSDNTIQLKDKENIRLLESLGLDHIERLAAGNKNRSVYNEPILMVFEEDINVSEVIRKLNTTDIFTYVEPDFIGTGEAACTNPSQDPSFSPRQWGLDNNGGTGTTIGFTPAPDLVDDADIDMPEGWSITTGSSNVTAGFLDTGLKLDHPEFENRFKLNYFEFNDGVDNDGNGFIDDRSGWDFVNNDNDPTDDNGHGTNVTGLAVATGDNSIGMAGVDWNCKILVAKVLDENNSGFYSNWIAGIYYLVDNGADVINASLGGTGFSAALETAVNYAYFNDVPVVAAAGNANSDVTGYPAGYANSIAVGATTTNNERAVPFTGGNPAGGSNYGNHLDITAPGDVMFSTNYLSNTNYNTFFGGTSQATPLVTGVVSLMKSIDSDLTFDEIKDGLTNGAVDQVGKPSEDTPGWDQYHGFGVLNAYNTLFALSPESFVDYQFSFGSFTWFNGVTYTSSNNTAIAVAIGPEGCDVKVRLQLMVFNNPWIFYNGIELSTEETSERTYQWVNNENNEIIPGATKATFTPTEPGSFSVIVKQNGAEGKSEPYSFNPLSISENTFGNEFTVYPNPTLGDLVIDLGTNYSNLQVKLFNANGQLISVRNIEDSNQVNINIEGPSGNYFIEITSNKEKTVIPVIKK